MSTRVISNLPVADLSTSLAGFKALGQAGADGSPPIRARDPADHPARMVPKT
ncbi:MAG TPA: hypothetical protein VK150_04150 [Geothrix sp.]|nr:hypothetical protein [Geothrix sp.]